MKNRKYKLVNITTIHPNVHCKHKEVFYQLKALIDIPLHGVKAGDLGGFVSSKKILSHEGSCWIGGTAKVYGHVSIKDDVYLGGSANITNYFKSSTITISEQVKVQDSAIIRIVRVQQSDPVIHTLIAGDVFIGGTVSIMNAYGITDNAKILGNAKIANSSICGDTMVEGNVTIGKNVIITGKNSLSGNAVLEDGVKLHDCIVSGNAIIASNASFSGKTFNKEGIFKNQEIPVFIIAEGAIEEEQPSMSTIGLFDSNPMKFDVESTGDSEDNENNGLKLIQEHFSEITEQIDAYQTDIVKIIKYPLMTDKTDSDTFAMTVAMGKANRCAKRTQSPQDVILFKEAVEDLEAKYILAEANALKMASTLLSEAEIKRTTKASDLFRLASNEAASEQEKKVAFIQGFKQLEGVLAVPEKAIMKFQAK